MQKSLPRTKLGAQSSSNPDVSGCSASVEMTNKILINETDALMSQEQIEGTRKRSRLDDDVKGDKFTQFQDAVMNMLTKINKDQELILNELRADIKEVKDQYSNIQKWKSDQDSILTKMSMDLAEVKRQNVKINDVNNEMEKALEFLSEKYDSVDKRVCDLTQESKTEDKKITELKGKLEEIQRVMKQASIEIRNVPATVLQTKMELRKIVRNTCSTLKVEVQPNDIRDVYRIKHKTGNNTIVANFSSVLLKSEILKAARIYNRENSTKLSTDSLGMGGKPVPIYISENLTDRERRLYHLARNTAKAINYKFCWTANGQVYMRKNDGAPHVIIADEDQLQSLASSD